MCRAAARGAGLPWGVADECARAARWLLRHRLPLTPLAELLEHREPVAAPNPTTRPLTTTDGKLLCPLLTGALLSDEAPLFARTGGCDLADAAHPILLAPFVAAWGERAALQWPGARVFFLREEVWVWDEDGALLHREVDHVAVRPPSPDAPPPSPARPPDFPGPDEEVWARLTTLAARTYVPAGESSRTHGAGAGLTDND